MVDVGRHTLDRETVNRLQKVFVIADRWRQRTHGSADEPFAGSSLMGDDAATDPYHVSHAVIAALVSAVDHLDTFRSLIQDARYLPARASYTVLRAALENGAVAVWLLAPQNRAERVLRRLRLQWADENDHANLSVLATGSDGDRLRTAKAKLQDIGRKYGLPQDKIASIASRPVTYGAIVEAAGDAGQGMTGRDAKWSWMVSSGIAHARTWAALAALDRTELKETAGGVVHLELQASEVAICALAQVATAMVGEGWSLLDRRRQCHY